MIDTTNAKVELKCAKCGSPLALIPSATGEPYRVAPCRMCMSEASKMFVPTQIWAEKALFDTFLDR